MEFVKLKLNTFYDYYVDDLGNVYKGDEKIGQWKHYPPKNIGGGPYMRCRLKMKDGVDKLFFVHRLMGIAYYNLKPGEIMRHGLGGCLDNRKTNLSNGFIRQNNCEDRLRDGNYFNRGCGKVDPLLNELATRLSEDIGF